MGAGGDAYAALAGWREDDAVAAFACFRGSAEALAADIPPLRAALPATPDLVAVARAALRLPAVPAADDARAFLERHFLPVRLGTPAFLTGYYEPVVEGALDRSEAFAAPILARPDDLEATEPYPDRAAIERAALEGRYRPLVWLRDWVEVFLIQVQGSARVRLPGGTTLRLTYAGRNRRPYTSVGRILVDEGRIAPAAMSLDRLKSWLRDAGQGDGERGRAAMARNRSYIFFAAAPETTEAGPTGAQGVPLTPLRSIAVDRTLWCYGLPFWIDAVLPGPSGEPQPFRGLTVAQDTGSAITGEARVDLFFGSGEAAGRRAGAVRHRGSAVLLRPRPVVGSGP